MIHICLWCHTLAHAFTYTHDVSINLRKGHGGTHCIRSDDILFLPSQEAAIEAKYTEVNALNKQRLQNLEFTHSLLNQVNFCMTMSISTIKTCRDKTFLSTFFFSNHISL